MPASATQTQAIYADAHHNHFVTSISSTCTYTRMLCLHRRRLTDADKRVEKIWNGGEHDVMCVSTKIPGHVCRQPLHDDVVGPVHAEVCNIYGPQWPVTDELCPPWTAVGHLCNVACQHYINDNNNYHDNIYGTVIMTKVTVRDHSVHLMNVD